MKGITEMTMLRQNAVVTLHRGEDVHKLYLNPGAYVEAHCASYLKEGWTMFSLELCSREDYLNYRINDVVEGINDISAERKNLRDQFRERKLSLEDYTTALTVTHELEMSDLRRLYRLMNRLAYEGLECHNEEAHQLYNMVF